jgi:hypothetical protein
METAKERVLKAINHVQPAATKLILAPLCPDIRPELIFVNHGRGVLTIRFTPSLLKLLEFFNIK